MRLFRVSLVLLCVSFLLSSCGRTVRDDLRANDIEAVLLTAIDTPAFYIPCSERYLFSVFPFSSAEYDHAVYRDATSTMNEFGVYACPTTAEAKRLALQIKEGIGERYEAFDDRYFVEEKEKYKNAVVKCIGRYVYYGILDDVNQKKITNLFIQKVYGDI